MVVRQSNAERSRARDKCRATLAKISICKPKILLKVTRLTTTDHKLGVEIIIKDSKELTIVVLNEFGWRS